MDTCPSCSSSGGEGISKGFNPAYLWRLGEAGSLFSRLVEAVHAEMRTAQQRSRTASVLIWKLFVTIRESDGNAMRCQGCKREWREAARLRTPRAELSNTLRC